MCTHAYVPAPGSNLRVPVREWFEALKNGAEVHDLVADSDPPGTSSAAD